MTDLGFIPSIKHVWLLLVHLSLYAAFALWLQVPVNFFSFFFASILIWVSCVDFAIYKIPDTAVVVLLGSGIAYRLWIGEDPFPYLLAAFLWFLAFCSIAVLARRILNEDGLGFGDVKLIGALAVWLGFVSPIFVILSASIAGIAVIVVLRLRDKEPFARKVVAFGPFLCLSTWVIWLSEATA